MVTPEGHVVSSSERFVLHSHVHLKMDEEVEFLKGLSNRSQVKC